jgi:predicted transcriptional regulator
MKTAISLADDLYHAADRFAARTNKTRSQLYAEALAEYLARHDEDEVTQALDAVYGGGHAPDPALEAAGRRRLLAEPW